MTEIRIPQDMWEDDRDGVVVSWLYRDGALVESGKLLTELAVEKAQLELFAPCAGRLRIRDHPVWRILRARPAWRGALAPAVRLPTCSRVVRRASPEHSGCRMCRHAKHPLSRIIMDRTPVCLSVLDPR